MAETGASPEATHGALGPAAERAGLSPREVAVTIRSAYRATYALPRPATGAGQGEAPHQAVRVESQVLS